MTAKWKEYDNCGKFLHADLWRRFGSVFVCRLDLDAGYVEHAFNQWFEGAGFEITDSVYIPEDRLGRKYLQLIMRKRKRR